MNVSSRSGSPREIPLAAVILANLEQVTDDLAPAR